MLRVSAPPRQALDGVALLRASSLEMHRPARAPNNVFLGTIRGAIYAVQSARRDAICALYAG
eukprot:6015197-Pyramimonas_sp.AAC.1